MRAPDPRILRMLGASLLLLGGAIHTWLAFDGYGTGDLQRLFLLNGVASAVVAAIIVLTRSPAAVLVGAGVAGVSLFALGLSRVGNGVVGFRGTGFEPAPEVPATIVVEVAAIVALAAVLYQQRRRILDAGRA